MRSAFTAIAARGALVLVALTATVPVARATTLLRLSVEEMTQRADDVTLGTVSSVESRWTDDHQQILTYVTLARPERLKGDDTGDVTFVLLGGRVGDDIMLAVGQPEFAVGEKALVFLTRMASAKRLAVPTDRWLLGLGQGKWSIATDRATGREVGTLDIGGARGIVRPGVALESRLGLETLRSRVRAGLTPPATR